MSHKRRKCREYGKNRRSKKWRTLKELYEKELSKAKKSFYRKKIKHLRTANPKQWHRELRKLTNFGHDSSEDIVIDDIKNLPKAEQAEIIADKFAEVSQEYDEIKKKT